MTTHILHLPGESLEAIRSIATTAFLDGECYAFAIALSRDLGWPLMGLMEGSVPRHAFAYRADSDTFYDVRGAHCLCQPALGEPFGHRMPYDLRELSEAALFSVRPVHERTIAHARRMAEILMPELPWKRSRTARSKEFCDELEALCRRHGLWIRSPYPAAKPVLCEAHGDEAGYTIEPTACGMQHTLDRRLKGEPAR